MLRANQVYYFKLLQIAHTNKLFVTPMVGFLRPYAFRKNERILPKCRINFGRHRLEYQLAPLLNRVEGEIDFTRSLAKFKRSLRLFLVIAEDHLTNTCYYHVHLCFCFARCYIFSLWAKYCTSLGNKFYYKVHIAALYAVMLFFPNCYTDLCNTYLSMIVCHL